MARNETMRFPLLVLTGLLVIGQASWGRASAGTETNQDQAPVQTPRGGNPLWVVPLAGLNVTGERPIFTPARRPPQPAATEAPATSTPQQTKTAAPDRPALSLLGTVTASDRATGIGIFIDDIDKRALRLKTGEQHHDWTLRRVQRGQVVLEKNGTRVTLALSPRDSAAPPAPALPAPVPDVAAEPAAARPRVPAPMPVAAFDWTSILRQGEAGSH
jgi:general secretion pathway protein N